MPMVLPCAARQPRGLMQPRRLSLLQRCRCAVSNHGCWLAPPALPRVQGAASGVGSVVKCGEEDDPIGVSTVLNLARHGASQPLQELRTFLLAAAGGHRGKLDQVTGG